jgi:hypothetical protein
MHLVFPNKHPIEVTHSLVVLVTSCDGLTKLVTEAGPNVEAVETMAMLETIGTAEIGGMEMITMVETQETTSLDEGVGMQLHPVGRMPTRPLGVDQERTHRVCVSRMQAGTQHHVVRMEAMGLMGLAGGAVRVVVHGMPLLVDNPDHERGHPLIMVLGRKITRVALSVASGRKSKSGSIVIGIAVRRRGCMRVMKLTTRWRSMRTWG